MNRSQCQHCGAPVACEVCLTCWPHCADAGKHVRVSRGEITREEWHKLKADIEGVNKRLAELHGHVENMLEQFKREGISFPGK